MGSRPCHGLPEPPHLRICQRETPAPINPTPSTTDGLMSTLTMALTSCVPRAARLLLQRFLAGHKNVCPPNWVCSSAADVAGTATAAGPRGAERSPARTVSCNLMKPAFARGQPRAR